MKDNSLKLPDRPGFKKNQEGNVEIHENFLNQINLLIVTCILAVSGGWATFNFPWSLQQINLGTIGSSQISFPLPVFALPCLIVFFRFLHLIANVKLVFCPEYLIYIRGIISWKEKSVRVDYKDIKEIEIDQTLYQKAVNLGDIVILIFSTQLESSLKMPGISNPRKVKDYIRELAQISATQTSLKANTKPDHN